MKAPGFVAFASLLALAPHLAGEATEEGRRQQALLHYRAGQEAYFSEAFEKAEREFQAAITLDPLLVMAHYGLGQVYMSTRRYPKAVTAYSRCRQAFHAEEARRLTDAAAFDRRVRDQIRELEDGLRALQSRSPTTQSLNLQSAIRRLETQIQDMKRRQQRGDHAGSPTPPGISLALGSAYFRTESLADAEREYLAALEVNPKLGEAHNNLAVVYLLTGRLPEAQEAVNLAEKSGFKVDPGLKEDLKRRAEAR